MKRSRRDVHIFEVVKQTHTLGSLLTFGVYKHDPTSWQGKFAAVPISCISVGLAKNTKSRRQEHPPSYYIKILSKFSNRPNISNKVRFKEPILNAFRSSNLALFNFDKKRGEILSVGRYTIPLPTTWIKFRRAMLERYRYQSLRCGLQEFLSRAMEARPISFIHFLRHFPSTNKYVHCLILYIEP